ncbi:MAG: PHP domain-containing protein [Chloroflexi bacterium]|nr:PHP domain-containing protein [Chloroflexota bacterium]
MIIDLHTHTYPTSDDSFLTPDQLVIASKEAGIDGICLTDHDGFWKPEDVEALSKRHSYPIFPGCEVTTEEGHILVFGLDRYIFGMHRAAFVRDLVDRAGGVMVVAHPYRRRFMEKEAGNDDTYRTMLEQACRSQVFSLVNAVEVMNGRGSPAENAFSRALAQRFNLPGAGASDCHKLEETGTFATELSRRVSTLGELINELKAGDYRPVALAKRRAD